MTPVGSGKAHGVREKLAAIVQATASRTLFLFALREGDLSRLKSAILGCTREVHHAGALPGNADETCIHLGCIGFVDLRHKPVRALARQLREQFTSNRATLGGERGLLCRNKVTFESQIHRYAKDQQRAEQK